MKRLSKIDLYLFCAGQAFVIILVGCRSTDFQASGRSLAADRTAKIYQPACSNDGIYNCASSKAVERLRSKWNWSDTFTKHLAKEPEYRNSADAKDKFNSIFSESRKKRAELLFTQAQAAARESLVHVRDLTNDLLVIANIDQMLNKLNRTRLDFPDDVGETLGFSAEFIRTSNGENLISVSSAIIILDDDPGSYFTIILHELGHVVSPGSIYSNCPNDDINDVYYVSAVRTYDGKYPFQSAFQCISKVAAPLSRECIGHAKVNPKGLVCYSRNNLSGILRVIESNPWIDKGLQRLCAIETGCEVGKFDEGFADWFAGKIMNELISGKLHSALKVSSQRDFVESGVGLYCLFSEILPSFGVPSSQDEHPQPSVRLNQLYFINSNLRVVMGCAPQSAHPCSVENF